MASSWKNPPPERTPAPIPVSSADPGPTAIGPVTRVLPWLALGLGAWVVSPVADPGPTEPCDTAVMVDGRLRCEAEAVAVATELAAHRPGAAPLAVGDALAGARLGRMDPQDLRRLSLPVDVNRASAAELASLPRIGPTLAGRIIQIRPFEDVRELVQVRGIGPKTAAKLENRARTGPTPVRP